MRRRIEDLLISVASALLVLIALVALDDRVRERAAALMTSHGSAAAVGTLGNRASDFAQVLVSVVRDQSAVHGPLVLFAVVATVLVLFMLRT
ncbi:MAG: hypothetical protein ACM3SQ_18610 [Betaproteobacteria bacterium]